MEKYIVITFNSLTLAKACYYCDNTWGIKNTQILHIPSVIDLPQSIVERYNAKLLPYQKRWSKFPFFAVVSDIKGIKNVWNAVRKEFADHNCQYNFVVFKDNEPRESTIIEKAKKNLRQRVSVILIEEGCGIYNDASHKVRYQKLWFLLYRVFGISQYCTKGLPQGVNPLVDEVICENTESFVKKQKKYCSQAKVTQQEAVFNCETNQKLLQLFCPEVLDNLPKKIDFVFLTMPWSDIQTQISVNQYKTFLTKLFEKLGRYGKVLVKLHPRDKFDYSEYTSKNVILCPQLDKLPFELLYFCLDMPTLVAISSSCCTCAKEKISYYLYKALFSNAKNTDISNDYCITNNIKMCSTIDELIEDISKHK